MTPETPLTAARTAARPHNRASSQSTAEREAALTRPSSPGFSLRAFSFSVCGDQPRQAVGQVHGQAALASRRAHPRRRVGRPHPVGPRTRPPPRGPGGEDALDVSQQLIEGQGPLRKVDQVRGVLGGRWRASAVAATIQPALRPSTSTNSHLPGKGAVVLPDIPHGAGEETRRRSVSRGVIGFRRGRYRWSWEFRSPGDRSPPARANPAISMPSPWTRCPRCRTGSGCRRRKISSRRLAPSGPSSRREVPSAEEGACATAARRSRA